MKKVVITSIAALSMTLALMLMLSMPVKAEYELDENGNLVKVETTTTTIAVQEESTVYVTIKVEETTKKAEIVTLPKVKKLKKKTKYSYYKGWKSTTDTKMSKIKYKYGIKLTWKRVKKATGYEIYRYENAAKKWTKIKNINKNKQKPSYTLTNMLKGENVKIKVRAYADNKEGRVYGEYSDVLEFKTKRMYTKIYKNNTIKAFYSKWASQDAFVIQNKYRKAAGVEQLVWSEKLYEIARDRCKYMSDNDDFSHDNINESFKNVLTKKYGIIDFTRSYECENIPGSYTRINWVSENISGRVGVKPVMKGWKNSKGHYGNMIDETSYSGAIALYRDNQDRALGCSLFSELDYDLIISELIEK